MKKTIGFMLPALRIGGAEVIALNYIRALCNDYDITVIVNKKEGELLNELPPNVKLTVDELLSFREIFKTDLKHFSFVNLLKDIIYYIKLKLKKNNEKDWLYIVSRTKKNTDCYDVLICFVANVSTQIFRAIRGFDCPKKIAWIHGETNELKNTELYNKFYVSFNNIVCVSKTTKSHFIQRYYSVEDRTCVIYNPMNRDEIIKKSSDNIDTGFEKNTFNILSIGRLSPEKGFIMIPQILDLINRDCKSVKWYLIGDGPSKNDILYEANKLAIRDMVLLGYKKNPYPYLKNCDLYVQPSFEEGYSTTINEACILGKAIVATECSGGIKEQIVDGKNGLLCKCNSSSIAKKIIDVINNAKLKHELENEAFVNDFSNSNSIDLFKSIIDE